MKEHVTVPNILLVVVIALMAWMLENTHQMGLTTAATAIRMEIVSERIGELKDDIKSIGSSALTRAEGNELKQDMKILRGEVTRVWVSIMELQRKVPSVP